MVLLRRSVPVGGLLLAALLAGCAASSEPAPTAAGAAVSGRLHTSQSPAATATPAAHAATTSPAAAKTIATSTRGETVLAAGVVLPNRSLTPGATNPTVTQATIARTICLTGYTKTIRPSSSYTTALKREQLAAGYNYRGDLSTSDYEEDHLVSLELGGSPTSVKNLWPEPYAAPEGARVKDKLENRLHDLVCSGQLSLRAAQYAIASNWWRAYLRYGGTALPTSYDGSYGGSTGTGSTSTSSSTGTATAQCRDGSYSYSQHRSGTCSHHGGVARWINPPPS
jgi:hypothetical protein